MVDEKEFQDLRERVKKLEEAVFSSKRQPAKMKRKTRMWYSPGGTIEKIITLIDEGFFKVPHTISEIVLELKTKDYHLKSSDLTLPLRRIVRKGLLRKTKTLTDGSQSKNWLYIKI